MFFRSTAAERTPTSCNLCYLLPPSTETTVPDCATSPTAADFSMPSRNTRLEESSAPSQESPSAALPKLPDCDTYSASGILENGPQSGDKDEDFFVRHPLTEEPSSEEWRPFLEIEEDYKPSLMPALLSRWARRWRIRSRRHSTMHSRKANNNNSISAIHRQSLQFTLKRRPSLFRFTLYLLGATLMLL